MAHKRNILKQTVLIASLAVLSVFLSYHVTTAYATLSLVDAQGRPSIKQSTPSKDVLISEQPVSRAPEPSTMALFTSGIFGMLISFVRRTYSLAKRAFDIASAFCAFLLLSPLFLLAAVLIKTTSKGPILYKQTRVGKDGKHFEIYKFRTMRVDAEKISGPVWAQENDPRLIPSGRFLRKSHIDEIPQFINVLKGEMSFIGPRPERPMFVEQFKAQIGDYEKRLRVKPGITGLAQVFHRYDETIEDVKKKIKYDLLYIRRMCLWTDIRIVLRTFRVVFTGEGAK